MSFLDFCSVEKLQRYLVILMAAFIPLGLDAAEWSFQPRVSLMTEYDDNKRLAARAHDSVVGTQLDIAGKLGMQTEKTEINVVPRARFSKYSGEKNLDSNDYFLGLNSLLIAEKTYWRFDADYIRDTSLASELEDTGLVQARKTREKILLIPSVTYEFSERTDLKAAIDFLRVEYMDAGIIGLVDYSYKTADIAVATQTGDTGELSISLHASRFEAADVGSQSDHIGLAAMYKRHLTDSMESELLFGVRKSDFDSGQSGDENGILFGLGINKEYVRTQWRLGLSRTINPIGSGSMVEKDRVSAKVSRSMTDRLQALARLSLLKQKSLEKSFAGKERRYSQFDVQLRWQITDGWSMRGGYRYRYNENDGMSNAADANSLLFEFVYLPPDKLGRHAIGN